MSLERELLGRAMSLIDYRYAPSEAVAVHREIQELLAQPEQEPIEDRIARWHKLGYALNEQEPVAWMWKKHTAGGWLDAVGLDKPSATAHQINIYPLYTSPPKREPLSSIKILELTSKHEYAINLIRAIEKAHGIGVGE